MRRVEARMAALAIAAAGLGALGAPSLAAAGMNPASVAFGLSGSLASHGTGTTIAPVARIVGGGYKAYSHSLSEPLFSESLGIVSAGNLVGTLAIVASGIATHVSSNGGAGTTVQAEADTSIASIELTLALVPPPGSTQPAAAPLLWLTATGITSQVMDVRTLPGVGVQTGTANFASLSLAGSMVGGQTLSFQGSAPPNTVLYSDANMTVTLNQQNVTGVVNCSPVCQFVPKTMAADAVQVEMFRKPMVGRVTASGQVHVAENRATVP